MPYTVKPDFLCFVKKKPVKVLRQFQFSQMTFMSKYPSWYDIEVQNYVIFDSVEHFFCCATGVPTRTLSWLAYESYFKVMVDFSHGCQSILHT